MFVNENNDIVSIIIKELSSSNTPKYRTIYMCIASLIDRGILKNGIKLPTHRALADDISVTSVTVSKAYKELEKTGLLTSQVGQGTFVSHEKPQINSTSVFRNHLDSQATYDMSRSSSILTPTAEQILNQKNTLINDQALRDVLSKYGPEFGYPHHQSVGLHWLKASGAVGNAEQIICTNGAQHALLCALLTTTSSGDTIVTEKLTYPGIIELAKHLGRKVVGLEYDSEGLKPEALLNYCNQSTCSAIYIMPEIQNPTGAVMTISRRNKLVDICRLHNIVIIEDDVFGIIPKQREHCIQSLAPERTLLLSGLSKIFTPGLRVGYLLVPQKLIARANSVIRTTCWMSSPTSHQIAAELITDGTAFSLLQHQREEIVRRKALTNHITEQFEVSTSEYCPHYLIKLPSNIKAKRVAEALSEQKAFIMTSEVFAVSKSDKNRFIRASISLATNDENLTKGFDILAQTLTGMSYQKRILSQNPRPFLLP